MSRGNPLQRQKELDLVDLVSKASNEQRHDPDKEHFVHQKPPYPDEEHFGSQNLIPKPLNQNKNNQTLRKDPAERGRNIATAHPNPDKWKTHLNKPIKRTTLLTRTNPNPIQT